MQATWLDPSGIRAALRAVRKLTDRPVGANLVLTEPRDDQLAAALAEGVQLVSFFWGDPAPYLARVHEAGALAALTVRSAAEARSAVDAGVDVVVAQGWEAGGHVWGDVATLPLVPAVRDAVGETPVVAAGGIADGRGLAAVLALGADAAWMGTRFVASEEAAFARSYKEGVAAAAETGTVHTSLFDGGWPDAPHRVLRTGRSSAGRPRAARRPAGGPARARSWRPRRTARRSSATAPPSRPWACTATSPRWPTTRGRARASSTGSSPRPRSCAARSRRPTRSCAAWLPRDRRGDLGGRRAALRLGAGRVVALQRGHEGRGRGASVASERSTNAARSRVRGSSAESSGATFAAAGQPAAMRACAESVDG